MALTKIDDRGLTTPIDLLDNEKIRFGTGNDGEIYFDGTDSIFTSAGKFRFKHGTDTAIKTLVDGGVYLSHDNSIKFYTTASGVFVGGHIDLDDNSELQIGTGDDLKIYHDGNHSYISDTGTGALILKSNDFNVQSDTGETMIWGDDNAAVKLYYDGSPKFETTSDGTQTTGRSRIYYGGNAGKPTLLIGADNAQGSTSLTNATQKACRVGMPHYTNAEEPTNMFHGVSGDGIAEVRYGGGTSYMNAATSHRFYTAANTTTTSGTEHMRIESDGDLRLSSDDVDTNYGFIDGWSGASGDMVLGSDHSTTGSNGSNIIFKTRGGEKVRIQHGGGISFNGDTAAANSLDDYEEGLWDLTGGSCNIDLHDSYDTGWYVKIGHVVTCAAYVQSDETSTDTAALTFTLPFATSALPTGGDTGWLGSCSMNSFAISSDVTQSSIVAGDAASVAYIRLNGGAAVGWTSLKKSEFTDGKLMQFTLTYKCQ